MRKFGIISGMGAFAGSRLYDLVNREAVEYALLLHGGDPSLMEDKDFPHMVIHQIPFASSDRFGMVEKDSFYNELHSSLLGFKAFGVTDVTIACNTMDHILAEAISKVGGFNHLSIIDEVGREISYGNAPILVLTSRQSREQNTYRDKISHREIIEADQELVDEMIHSSMTGLPSASLGAFTDIVDGLSPETEILLGCTELSVYANMQNSHLVVDSLQILAEKVVKIHHENS